MYRALACVAVLGLLGGVTGPAGAQVVIDSPQEAADAGKKTRGEADIPPLVARLSDDKGWWKARTALVKLAAKGRRMEVLRALQAAWMGDGSDVLRIRTKVVADEVNRQYTDRLRRRELRDRMEQVRVALAELQRAAGGKEGPVRIAAAKLASAVEKLDRSLSSRVPEGARVFGAGQADGIPSGARVLRTPDGRMVIIEGAPPKKKRDAGDGKEMKIIRGPGGEMILIRPPKQAEKKPKKNRTP